MLDLLRKSDRFRAQADLLQDDLFRLQRERNATVHNDPVASAEWRRFYQWRRDRIRKLRQQAIYHLRRAEDLRDDLKRRTVSDILNLSDAVLMPEFNTRTMHDSASPLTSRELSFWSHASFRDLMINMAKRLGKRVFIVSER